MTKELEKANGIDINIENMLGYTPLHFAIQKGHTETIKALLTANKDKDKDGFTPLYHSSASASVDSKNGWGRII